MTYFLINLYSELQFQKSSINSVLMSMELKKDITLLFT